MAQPSIARIAALLALVATLMVPPALAFGMRTAYAAPAAGMSLSRARVAPGDTVQVKGTNFAPATTAFTYLRLPVNGRTQTVGSSTTVTASGTFTTALTVPAAAASGSYTVVAQDSRRQVARRTLTVLPLVRLTAGGSQPAVVVLANHAFFVTGSGFKAGEPVQLVATFSLANGGRKTVARSVQAGADGTFGELRLVVPAGTTGGAYTLIATGSVSGGRATATLRVPAASTLSVQQVRRAPGETITVMGRGFSHNVDITLTSIFPLYGGGSRQVVGTVRTSSDGTFAATFTVPEGAAPGRVRIVAAGPARQARTTILVTSVPIRVTVSPANAAPGSSLNVQGTGYPSNDTVTVQLRVNIAGGGTKMLTGTTHTGARGGFSTTLVVPGNAVVGSYTVTAKSLRSGRVGLARISLSVHAAIAVAPGGAMPGRAARITGMGFARNASIAVSASFPLYGGGSKTVTQGARTSATGTLDLTLAVPADAAAGTVIVVATGPNVRTTADLRVRRIEATIAVTPASVLPGGTIAVQGANYPTNDTVQISATIGTLGGGRQTLTATARTDSGGRFSAALHVPANATGGGYTVVARSGASGRAPSTRLTVVTLASSIVVSPAVAVPGDTVTVNGFGYAAGATVALTLDGSALKSVTAGSNGRFSTQIVIPTATAAGTSTVTASSGAGRTATASLTVNRQVATRIYFASLYTGRGYHEYLALLNPTATRARVTITYQRKDGTTRTKEIQVNGRSRLTEDVNADLGARVSAAAVVAADVPVVAERFVTHYSSLTGGAGVTSPARTWYFANGNTSGRYREYIAIQNPNTTVTRVAIHLLPTHRRAMTVYRTLRPTSRTTIKVNAYVRDAVGVRVSADAPVVANRTVYIRQGMTSKPGVSAPQRSWYFAAGPPTASARNWIGAINPSGAWNTVTLRAFDRYGRRVARVHARLRPGARVGYLLNRIARRSDVSVVLSAARPIVAEQMTYRGRYHLASTDTFGATTPGTSWAFAAVTTLNSTQARDVLDVFNPSGSPAPVVVQFMNASGATVQRTYVVGPMARRTIYVGSVVPNAQLGLVVTSTTPLVVMNRQTVNGGRGAMTGHGISL